MQRETSGRRVMRIMEGQGVDDTWVTCRVFEYVSLSLLSSLLSSLSLSLLLSLCLVLSCLVV